MITPSEAPLVIEAQLFTPDPGARIARPISSLTANRRAKCVCFAAGVCLWIGSALAHAQHVLIFKWVDPDDQQVHYGDRAPDNADYEMVAGEEASPTDAAAERRLKALADEVDQWLAREHERQVADQRTAAELAARELDCVRAKDQLEKLDTRPGNRLRVTEADGTARRMTEDERQAHIADVTRNIESLCAVNRN